ncbi:hypothetical protein LCGC14_0476040 [marine sediment metagenome]|uniref:PD-(D/E)XK endonuclease-like domain-containing protein n=1 Tax=marine sediment metagenome TaxID=412755 RepID=A0A0F9STN4_9ZZZZ
MKLTEIPDIKAPVSQSSFGCGMRCKRCYLLKYRWGLRLKTRQYAPAATLGDFYHLLKKEGPSLKGTQKVREIVRKMQDRLVEQIENGEDMTGDLARLAGEITNLYHKALVMAQIFWAAYPPNPRLVTLCKEETIEAVIAGLPAKGILDHVQGDSETGQVWIRDEKSSSLPFEDLYTGYEFSIQCRWYRLLAEAYLKTNLHDFGKFAGNSIVGFILDYMMTPGIQFGQYDRDFTTHTHVFKRGARAGQSEIRKDYSGEPKFENYLKRVEEWYKDNTESSPIRSMGILFSEPLLPPEMAQDLETMKRLYSAEAVPENFPRDITKSYCRAYKKTCVFYDLCVSDQRIWPDMISGMYTLGNLDHQDKEKEKSNVNRN